MPTKDSITVSHILQQGKPLFLKINSDRDYNNATNIRILSLNNYLEAQSYSGRCIYFCVPVWLLCKHCGPTLLYIFFFSMGLDHLPKHNHEQYASRYNRTLMPCKFPFAYFHEVLSMQKKIGDNNSNLCQVHT